MKQYVEPEMEITFMSEDIITTSPVTPGTGEEGDLGDLI